MPAKKSNLKFARMRQEIEAAAEELPGEHELQFRPMFGGMGIYCRGRVFALFIGATISLKLDEAHHEELLRERGAARLQFGEDGPVTKLYIVVPPHVRQNPAKFARWVGRSVKFVSTLPAPKARRKRA